MSCGIATGRRRTLPDALIGSVNAIATVQQMQQDASRRDRLREPAALRLEPPEAAGSPAGHADAESPLDIDLRECTGRITLRRFPGVQNRSGYFSGRPTPGPENPDQEI